MKRFFRLLSAWLLTCQFVSAQTTTVTATKDDGTPAATKVPAGGTVNYTNTITNTGSNAATNLSITDPDITNASMVPGSLQVSPIAYNDAYTVGTVFANTSINTNNTSEFSVTANDYVGINADNPATITITAFDVTSSGNGTVAMVTSGADMGKFSYEPAPGFTGIDTFSYTITNSAGMTDSGVVSITVTGPVVWYVNVATGSDTTGKGTLSSPYATVNRAATASAAGHRIFVASGTYNGTSITLDTNEMLIGQGVVGTSFDAVVLGGTPSADTTHARPAINGTKPIIARLSGGNTVTLSNGNTIVGCTIANVGGGYAVIGNAITTLQIGNAAPGAAADTQLTSTGTSLGCLSLTGAASGNVNVTAQISATVGRSLNISDRTGGTLSIIGKVTDNGSGVLLSSNTGATLNLRCLVLNTSSNTALTAISGGTLNITNGGSDAIDNDGDGSTDEANEANVITTTSGQALNVSNTNIGASGLTFRSISSGAGANNGITLVSTGTAGGLTVTGDGSANSGGTISGKTGSNGSNTDGIGIYLSNTSNVSLNRMLLQNFQNFAIRGFNVSGFAMANCTVNATSGTNGNDAASNEGSIAFGDQLNSSLSGLSGTVTISNCVIANGHEDNFVVSNHTGTMNFTMTGSTVRDTSTVSPGNEGLAFYAEGSSNMNISVQGSSFLRNRANGIHVINQSTGTVNFDLGTPGSPGSGGTFTDNTIGVHIVGNDSGATNFDILHASFTVPNFPTLFNAGGASSQININMGGDAVVAERGAITGNILNNSVNMNGSATGPAVRIIANGTDNTGGNTITFKFDSNTVTGGENFGLQVLTRDGNAGINATITNNTVTTNDGPLIPGNGAAEAIRVDAGATSTAAGTGVPDSGFINLDLAGNNAETPDDTGLYDVRIRQRFGTTYRLENIGGTTNNAATAIAYLATRNPATTGANTFTADNAATGSAGFLNIASVTEPPAPLLFAPGEPEDFSFGTPDTVATAIAWTETARHHSPVVNPKTESSSPQATDNNEPVAGGAVSILTQGQLDPIVTAARERWAATGLTDEQLRILDHVSFEVVDLPGWYLGENSGDIVRLDVTAGGNGWFIDTTPLEDEEFNGGVANSSAKDRIDLLTTIMHEMGHALGLCDHYNKHQRGGLMHGFLTKGERRLPAKGQAAGAKPHLHASPHHLGSPITIANLPPGKSLTIKYSVTVNNDPLTWVGTTLHSQATVSTTNGVGTAGYFPSVVTNDPETPAANDATITLLDRPDATIVSLNRSSGNPTKNPTVTWQIVFSSPVKGITASNFALVNGGLTTPTITGVTESGTETPPGSGAYTTWNITASTGSGDGTLSVNFINDTNVSHDVTTPLPFAGQMFTIDKTPPSTISFTRLTPASPDTNADLLVFRVTFSENVTGVDATDFTVTGTTATVTNVATFTADSVFDLSVSGGDLASFNGTVGLNLNSAAPAGFITDLVLNNLPKTEPATDQTYSMDNTAPTVAMSSSTGNPTTNAPIPVTVEFSESVSGFAVGDIVVANATVQNFAGSGSVYTFDLVPSGPGVTATADIPADVAADAAGNGNSAATQFSRTIVDQVSIAATTATAVEGGATGLYTFTRILSTGALTVNFELDLSSSAVAATDFTLTGTGVSFDNGTGLGSIVIPNGSTSATITLTALVESPNPAEAAETARLNVTSGTGYVAAAAPNENATVTITENSFLVTTTNDSGTGSLRQAVLNANTIAGTDTITFSDGTGGTVNFTDTTADTITLTSGQLSLSSNAIIQGTGARKLAVSGNNASRVFLVNAGATVRMSGLTVTGGTVGTGTAGGGILNNGTLVVLDSAITGNANTGTGPGGGLSSGNIFAAGAVTTVVNSTFSGNSASSGGGVYTAVSNNLTLINCTFSGNTTLSSGGAVLNNGTTSLYNTTISGNTANHRGGGIAADTNTLTLANCIVAGNTASTAQPDVFRGSGGTLTSNGGNLIGNGQDTLNAVTWAGSDLTGTNASPLNPQLAPLADNGGPTQTRALLPSSPAINAGNNALLPADTLDLDGDTNTTEAIPFDQRGTGFARAIGTVDIGAFELQKSVSIAALDSNKAEGTGAGTTAFTFTVSRTGDTTGDATVDYAVTGAAVNAADFGGTLPSGQVTITNGNASTTLTINVTQDTLAELDENFTVTLSNPSSGYLLTTATATGTIINDDLLTVAINQAAAQADPANTSPVNFTVIFSEPVTGFDSAADVTLSGTALPTASVITGGPSTYNVAVSGMSTHGTVMASIPAAAALSAGSAANQASTSTDNTVTYDATAPDSTITGNPTNPSSSSSATFTFTGSDVGTGIARFETRIDGGSFATATSPQTFTGLAQGSHTFQVRAVDAAGNVDPTPASYTWVVDTIAPDTTIISNPPSLSSSSSATFSFIGDDGDGSGVASFQVSLDSGPFTSSTSPRTYTGLADGDHTFRVRAIDAAGNADATPASYTWTIDTTPPPAPVVVTPANASVTNNPLPVVSGTAEPGSTVTIFIDGSMAGNTQADGAGNWSFTPTIPLADGSRTFRARATDAASNTSPDSSTNTITVDTVEPDTTITGNPVSPSNSASATFTFTGNGTGSAVASYQASLDGAAFTTATSPQTYTGLSDGPHTFRVRAIDAAGNVDSTPASYTWTVDTVPPTVELTTPAASPAPNALFTVTAQFSEDVLNFIATDITVVNAVLSNFTAVDGDTYTFDLTPNGPGLVVTADIAASVASDAAGNGNTAATQLSRTIIDAVSITATTATAVEGGATGTYTFSRTNTTAALVVDFQLDASTIASADDYSLSGASVSFDPVTGAGSVTIPAGQTSVALTLTAIPEADIGGGQAAEPSETIRLNVLPRGTDYTAGTPNNATVTIAQNGFVVVNTNDAGDGSLRQAILNANAIAGANTITFAGAVFTDATADEITLSGGQLTLSSDITLQGLGARVLTLRNTATNSRVLNITTGTVLIRGVTITGGSLTSFYSHGGGILSQGNLTLIEVAVRGNGANGPGSEGGGIHVSAGNLTIANSTINGNSATFSGGGLKMFSSGTGTFVNSTFSGNSSQRGAGIYVEQGTVTISHSTITKNVNTDIFAGLLITVSGNVVLRNTLIAANEAPSDSRDVWRAGGTLTSEGGNVFGNGVSLVRGTFTAYAPSDLTGTLANPLNPLLGPLADNGGPTDTHALLNGSPAINNGLVANLPADSLDLDGDLDLTEAIPFDQRGDPNLRVRGPKPDSGAYETFAFEPTISAASTSEDEVTASGLVISANTADGGLTTHFQITSILNGALFRADGVTEIHNGDFITLAEGTAGLKFLPHADANDFNTPAGFGFTVQAAMSSAAADLRGATVTTVIPVASIADLPGVTNATTIVDVQTTTGLVLTKNVVDDADVTVFLITNIQNGTLYQNNGSTLINNGDSITIAQGTLGLKFTPAPGYTGTASFDVQAALDSSGTGASGVVTANIQVQHPVPVIAVQGPLVLNLRSGLFEHVVRVSNPHSIPMNGFRLAVTNLPPDVLMWNRTHPFLPVIEDTTVLPAGGFRDVLVSYYISTRRIGGWVPIYEVENLSAEPDPLPGDLSGTWHGFIGRSAISYVGPHPQVGSILNLSVSKSGSVTGVIIEGIARRSFTARLSSLPGNLASPQLIVSLMRGSRQLKLTFNAANNSFLAQLSTASADAASPAKTATAAAIGYGWRKVWNVRSKPATAFKGRHNLYAENTSSSGPQGYGTLTANVTSLAGNVAVSGRLPDGSAITGSTFVGPQGQMRVYKSLYGNKGSAQGVLQITAAIGAPQTNFVFGLMDWFKPKQPSTSRDTVYKEGFGTLQMLCEGAYYERPAPGQLIGGVTPVAAGSFNTGLDFFLGGLDEEGAEFGQSTRLYNPTSTSRINRLQVIGSVTNSVTITSFDSSTGIFTGSYKLPLPGTSPVVKRTVPFRGLIVPACGCALGYGYFLLPQIPVAPQTLSTVPKLSGAVEFFDDSPP